MTGLNEHKRFILAVTLYKLEGACSFKKRRWPREGLHADAEPSESAACHSWRPMYSKEFCAQYTNLMSNHNGTNKNDISVKVFCFVCSKNLTALP